MKLVKVGLTKKQILIPSEIASPESFFQTLRNVTFPESFFLFQSQKPFEKGVLERAIYGMPGVRISDQLQQEHQIFSFRLLSAELLLPVRFLGEKLGFTPEYPLTWSAYFAKAKNSGLLALHEDLHDVFVFQIFGKRVWEVDGKKIELSAGDVLEIPLGTKHRVLETPEDSLHVTVGHHFPTSHALIRDLLEKHRAHPLFHQVVTDKENFQQKFFEFLSGL